MSSELRPERSEQSGTAKGGAGQFAEPEDLGRVANRRSVTTPKRNFVTNIIPSNGVPWQGQGFTECSLYSSRDLGIIQAHTKKD